MNLKAWKQMFNSKDLEICKRTSENGRIISHYTSAPFCKDVSSEAMRKEMADFNEFAQEKIGSTIFDLSAQSAYKEVSPVEDYLLQLGLARSRH